MSNKFIKDDNVKILLDRREEIKNTINKLELEYSAIGNLLRKIYDYEHNKPLDIKPQDYER